MTRFPAVGLVTTIGLGTAREPRGIAVDSAGNVYTANAVSNNVTKITPAGVATILGSTSPGTDPEAIAVDAAGNVYTANHNSNNVTKITPAGISSIVGTTGSTPEAIAIDAAGNVYTANSGSNTVTKITVDQPLTVTKAGTGSGAVSSSPAGIDCGTSCSAQYAGGTSVTLTATAAAGSTFSGWGGACSGTTSTCTVAMSKAQAVTATFAQLPTPTIKRAAIKAVTTVVPGAIPSTTIVCSTTRDDALSSCTVQLVVVNSLLRKRTTTVIGKATQTSTAGAKVLKVKIRITNKKAQRALAAKGVLRATVRIAATTTAGQSATATKGTTLKVAKKKTRNGAYARR